MVNDVSLEDALAFLVVLPFIPLLIRDFRARRSNAAVALTGLEYLQGRLKNRSCRRRVCRSVLWTMVVTALGLLCAHPMIESHMPLFEVDMQTRHKNIIFAIDVSRSMSGPLEMPDKEARLAAYGKGTDSGAAGRSRYDGARDTVYSFIERFPDARSGLILFSAEPFLARWPTTDTSHAFIEILEEELRGDSQLQRFSSLTNIDAALELANEVLANEALSQGGAVILISDAEDELENVEFAIRTLRENGIRLYIIGVGISEVVVDSLSQKFAGDPGFRIFRADSAEEMSDAYQLVSGLEASPRYSNQERIYVTDMRKVLALALAIISCVAIAMIEAGLHRTEVIGRGGLSTP